MATHLTLPAVQSEPTTRPAVCLVCDHWHLQRHGSVCKPIHDQHLTRVRVHRYRCAYCRHTFRHYPTGVTAADHSQRLLGWLSERWSSYWLCARRADVPATNNRSEQAIGRIKVRSRTVRGYKSEAGLLNASALAGVVGTGRDLDLQSLMDTPVH